MEALADSVEEREDRDYGKRIDRQKDSILRSPSRQEVGLGIRRYDSILWFSKVRDRTTMSLSS